MISAAEFDELADQLRDAAPRKRKALLREALEHHEALAQLGDRGELLERVLAMGDAGLAQLALERGGEWAELGHRWLSSRCATWLEPALIGAPRSGPSTWTSPWSVVRGLRVGPGGELYAWSGAGDAELARLGEAEALERWELDVDPLTVDVATDGRVVIGSAEGDAIVDLLEHDELRLLLEVEGGVHAVARWIDESSVAVAFGTGFGVVELGRGRARWRWREDVDEGLAIQQLEVDAASLWVVRLDGQGGGRFEQRAAEDKALLRAVEVGEGLPSEAPYGSLLLGPDGVVYWAGEEQGAGVLEIAADDSLRWLAPTLDRIVALAPDGDGLLALRHDGSLHAIATASGQAERLAELGGPAFALAGLPDGRVVVVRGNEVVWLELESVAVAEPDAGSPSPSADELAAAPGELVVLRRGAQLRCWELADARPGPAWALGFDPEDQAALATGGSVERPLVLAHHNLGENEWGGPGRARLFDARTRESIADGEWPERITAATISTRGTIVVALEAGEREQLVEWGPDGERTRVPCVGGSVILRARPGTAEVLSGQLDTAILAIDLERRRERVLLGHERAVGALECDASGRYAVSIDTDFQVRCWDLEHGQATGGLTLDGTPSLYSTMSAAVLGELAVVTAESEAPVCLELGSGEPVAELEAADGPSSALAASPDGIRVAGIADGAVCVWLLETTAIEARWASRATIVALVWHGDHALMALDEHGRVTPLILVDARLSTRPGGAA